MTTDIQLPKVTQARIAKLAQVAGRSPAAMLRFVLRDGFDAVEQSIRENAIADVQFRSGLTHAHDDVMADAKKLLREDRQGVHSAA
jgi:DNA-binding MurR/RpiR family transcriptional regulator